MFYTGREKTHLKQLEKDGTSHGKLASDIFGSIVTHVNIFHNTVL